MTTPIAPDDQALIAAEMQRRTAAGWQVVSQSPAGVQFKRQAQGGPLGLVGAVTLLCVLGGFIFTLLWGLALLGLIVVAVLATQRRDEVAFVSAADLRAKAAQLAGGGKAEKIPAGASATCSACGGPVRQAATSCKRCGAVFVN